MMRRKDREIVSWDEIVLILKACPVVRLGMTDGKTPYIIPLNFGMHYMDGTLTLYFHSAKEGRKIDILKSNPHVCFEADTSLHVVAAEKPCEWSAGYESVIGYGTILFLTDEQERKAAMDSIMEKYGFQGVPAYAQGAYSRTLLYKLTVQQMSGKRNVES